MHFQISWTHLILGTMAALALVTPPAAAAPSGAPSPPVALDATHFVLVRGDRVIVYEVDPKRGYDMRVVNSAVLDEQGFIMGQFRPTGQPAVSPSRPAAPLSPVPAPRRPEVPPTASPDPVIFSTAGATPAPKCAARSGRTARRRDPAPRKIAAR